MEEDLEDWFGEVAFFWSGRQVCFLWEPKENCLGNLLTAPCHFAEAVDAECRGLRWSNHRSGDAGCACPSVPEVSAFPLQPSTNQSPEATGFWLNNADLGLRVRSPGPTRHRDRVSHAQPAVIAIRENQLHTERTLSYIFWCWGQIAKKTCARPPRKRDAVPRTTVRRISAGELQRAGVTLLQACVPICFPGLSSL